MNFMKKTFGAAIVALSVLSLTPAHADGELTGKTLTISVDPTNPPFVTLDSDYRTPVGLDVDIIRELQKRLGFEIKDDRIYPMLRGSQLRNIKSGRVDVIAGCLSATKARSAFMDFTPVYYDTGLTMIYSKTKYGKATDLEPFKRARVAGVEGSVALDFIPEQLPGAELVEVPSFMVGIISVAQGKVDGMIHDRPIIEYFAQSMPAFNLDIIDESYERQYCQIALGLTKDSPYTEHFSRELDEMIKDGTLDQMVAKYIK